MLFFFYPVIDILFKLKFYIRNIPEEGVVSKPLRQFFWAFMLHSLENDKSQDVDVNFLVQLYLKFDFNVLKHVFPRGLSRKIQIVLLSLCEAQQIIIT